MIHLFNLLYVFDPFCVISYIALYMTYGYIGELGDYGDHS